MSSAGRAKRNAPLHLITGAPGTGKTTAIRTLVSMLPSGSFTGFYTEEMRESGQRVGFRAVTFSASDVVLAHVSFRTGPRVGKYRVDIPAFDKVAVREIDPSIARRRLFVVDEIGRMECFSDYFVKCVLDILASGEAMVGTVAFKGWGLIADVKKIPGASLHRLNAANRESLPLDIMDGIQDWLSRSG
jgi:nucleoside-triphosphatase